MSGLLPYQRRRRLNAAAAAAIVAALSLLGVGGLSAASADSFVPVSGSGSTWSQNALNSWISDVKQNGIRVNYAGTGSTDGRHSFLQGTVDFAASDIPFQSHPQDGSAPENPAPGSYAYMPVTAGGTSFMYNLSINGQRVTNLRLSGQNITKIFTGTIVNWSDPALQADNPQLLLPNESIVPVVRSDGSGSTQQFTEWMISQYPSLWTSLCQRSGRAPACGPTSFYPTVSGMIAQNGDLGVAGYVAQNFAAGAIGYVQYSYALNAHFPVAKMLNSAGYYNEPTPPNVAVSLLQAEINITDTDPSLYLTQKLGKVYTDSDTRSYPLSSYSYLILPTTVKGSFSTSKGKTLAAFASYAMCQGQQSSASLGYSPMPINLVQASFTQITKIPGSVPQNVDIKSCGNPTFSANGTNTLATTAPAPPACDKQGATQCSTGTGGDRAATTVIAASSGQSSTGGSGSKTAAGGTGAKPGAASSAGSGNGTGTSAVTAGGTTTGSSPGAAGGSTSGSASQCNADTGVCSGGTGSGGSTGADSSQVASAVAASPYTLPPHKGWGTTQSLMLIAGLLLLALILLPGLVSRFVKIEVEDR